MLWAWFGTLSRSTQILHRKSGACTRNPDYSPAYYGDIRIDPFCPCLDLSSPFPPHDPPPATLSSPLPPPSSLFLLSLPSPSLAPVSRCHERPRLAPFAVVCFPSPLILFVTAGVTTPTSPLGQFTAVLLIPSPIKCQTRLPVLGMRSLRLRMLTHGGTSCVRVMLLQMLRVGILPSFSSPPRLPPRTYSSPPFCLHSESSTFIRCATSTTRDRPRRVPIVACQNSTMICYF